MRGKVGYLSNNLSKELAGVILPHDHFGTHLYHNNQTINEDLELKNFEHAGGVLSELWSNLVIDGHPVVAEYIKEEPSEITIDTIKSEEWKANMFEIAIGMLFSVSVILL